MTVLVSFILGLVIYGPAIRLPLYLDDAPQFRWLAPLNIPQIWYTFQIASFYRPVPFTIFKLLWILQSGYHAPTLHLLVILLHIANGILIGLVARRLTRWEWSGPVAAALMITFPFAYQAVPWVTSVFHIALLTGVLGTILLSLRYLDTGSRGALVGAWLAAFLGIFSHENGVMLPFLVGIVLLAVCYSEGRFRANLRRLLGILIPLSVIVALYFFAWLTVPKPNDFSHGIQRDAFEAKIAYVGQSLIYPFSALARPLIADNATIIPVVLVLTAAVLILVALTADLVSRPQPGCSGVHVQTSPLLIHAFIAVLWVIIAAIPAMLLLTTNYLLGSPRLLYLSGAGVALFWAAWFAAIARCRVGRLIGGIVIAGFVALGMTFSIQRMDAHLRIGAFYQQLAEILKAQPEKPAFVANAPSYLAPPTEKTTFLMGSEGATFLAYYISLQDLLWVNTGKEYPVKTAAFNNTLAQNPWEIFSPTTPWIEWDQLDEQLGSVQSVYAISLSATEFHPVRVGDKFSGKEGESALADFGSVALQSASISQGPDDTALMLILAWEVRQPMTATPFVHVMCDGAMATQADGPPLGGAHPLDRWKAGERWMDRRELKVDLRKLKVCSVVVGLYNPSNGERYRAKLADGSTTDEVAVPYITP